MKAAIELDPEGDRAQVPIRPDRKVSGEAQADILKHHRLRGRVAEGYRFLPAFTDSVENLAQLDTQGVKDASDNRAVPLVSDQLIG